MPTRVSPPFLHPHRASSHCLAGHPDYWPSNLSPSSGSSSSSSGSSTNIGAIVGGTVGGAVGLLLILVGGYVLYRRQQYRRLRNTDGAAQMLYMDTPMVSTHTGWRSDPSTFFPSSGAQSQEMGPQMSVLSPPSYSHFQVGSPPPPTETASFLTTGNEVVQRTRAIPIV